MSSGGSMWTREPSGGNVDGRIRGDGPPANDAPGGTP
jgi:hypothetical protein